MRGSTPEPSRDDPREGLRYGDEWGMFGLAGGATRMRGRLCFGGARVERARAERLLEPSLREDATSAGGMRGRYAARGDLLVPFSFCSASHSATGVKTRSWARFETNMSAWAIAISSVPTVMRRLSRDAAWR